MDPFFYKIDVDKQNGQKGKGWKRWNNKMK